MISLSNSVAQTAVMSGVVLSTYIYCFHLFWHLAISEVYARSSQEVHRIFHVEVQHSLALEQTSDDASRCP